MTQRPDELAIASRGSRLALRQAEIVADMVRAAHPAVRVRVAAITTRGDVDQRPFAAIGAKGLFVKEVERELLEGRADVAVHSAKDLTAQLAPRCSIACVPARGPVFDVVVGGIGASGYDRLAALPAGATVGTSSMRRRALLAEMRPDLEPVDLRGNLDTRVARVSDAGGLDAAVVAAAGLERLGVDGAGALDPSWWVPAPGQGCLAIEALEERSDIVALLAPLHDERAGAELACERAFGASLEGGCSVPLGCLGRADGARLVATGFLGAPEGSASLRDRVSGAAGDAESLGRELAEAILAAGGREVLKEIAASEAVQPSAP
jgi:hydroxymethylbilane synthase